MLEEAYYAALDKKANDWANAFLRVITKEFPQTPKTMRMLGMLHESLQDQDKARDIYSEILQANASDFQTLKRLIALERDSNKLGDAIQLLNKYLEANQQDTEAWLELSDIYLARQSYDKAQYCYEELLTFNPNNFIVNLRYAEIIYS